MDGVRLTPPTVLHVGAPSTSTSRGVPNASSSPLLQGVLLAIAQGEHKIAFHHPPNGDGQVHGFDPQVLADLLLTKPALFEQLFDLTVGERRLIGWPLSISALRPVIDTSAGEDDGAEGTNEGTAVATPSQGASTMPSATPQRQGERRLRAFSLVFVLRAAPAAGEEARYARALAACKSAAHALAHALQREEACGGIVSRHVAMSMNAPGGRTRQHGGGASCCGSGGGGSGGRGDGDEAGVGGSVSIAHVGAPCTSVHEASSFEVPSLASAGIHLSHPARHDAVDDGELAHALRQAFRAIQDEQPLALRMGSCTDVAICAPPPLLAPPRLAAASNAMPPPPPLRPYLALLPLESVQTISHELPNDASPLLIRLVLAANPLLTLEQLADETAIQMPLLLRLVSHLRRWGKVRLIHPLTQDSVLCVHPDAPRHAPPALGRELAEDEPSYESLLQLFDAAQRFSTIIRAAEALRLPKRRLVQITIALMRCGALRALHTYVHCVREPPPPTEEDLTSPLGATAVARWRLFRRLRPMLYGEHHLTEIMWHERLSRDVLDDLFGAYEALGYVVRCVTFDGEQ